MNNQATELRLLAGRFPALPKIPYFLLFRIKNKGTIWPAKTPGPIDDVKQLIAERKDPGGGQFTDTLRFPLLKQTASQAHLIADQKSSITSWNENIPGPISARIIRNSHSDVKPGSIYQLSLCGGLLICVRSLQRCLSNPSPSSYRFRLRTSLCGRHLPLDPEQGFFERYL
jgi:hypothetical protein